MENISKYLNELSRKRDEASSTINSLKDQIENLEGQIPELDKQMEKLRGILDLNTNTVSYLSELLKTLNEFLSKYKEIGLNDYEVSNQVHQLEMIIASVNNFLNNGYEVSNDLNHSEHTISLDEDKDVDNTILFTPQTNDPELSTVSFDDDIPSEELGNNSSLDSSLESLFNPQKNISIAPVDSDTFEKPKDESTDWFNSALFSNTEEEINNKPKGFKVVSVAEANELSNTSSLDTDLLANEDDYTLKLGRAA